MSGFLFGNMARFYINEEQTRALMTKNNAAGTPHRISDLRAAVYGSNRQSSELTYLRGQNGSDSDVDTRYSNAWATFAGAQGVTSSSRDIEQRNLFWKEQDYP